MTKVDDLNFWSDNNILVEQVYNSENILVKDYGNSDMCYIFFTSNNLFYPNTVEEFTEKLIGRNRFEWEKMAYSRNIVKKSGRHIFVRDIYKQWYVTGCSSKYCNHDLLLEHLKELTVGYRIITVGSSAGGYMAMLTAIVLNAESCFDFSGQVCLDCAMADFYERKNQQKITDSPYYDLAKIIDNSKYSNSDKKDIKPCKFYYFYPAYNDVDVARFETLPKLSNILGFSFNQKNHAATMMATNMRYILTKDENYMARLYERYNGKVINMVEFFFRTVPLYMWIPLIWREARAWLDRRIGE